MTLSQTLLGSAVGLGARVLEGFQRRKANKDRRDNNSFSKQLITELDRRLQQEANRRAQEESAIEEEFNRRLIEEYQRRLAEQQIQAPTPTPIHTEEIPEAPYPSSNIAGFKYDPKNKRMFVQFLDKYPNRNGPKYVYENVDPFIYDVIKKGAVAPKTSGSNKYHTWYKDISPSLGASVYHLLKMGNYRYQRIG